MGAVALLMAFFPLLGRLVNMLLVPACLFATIVGLVGVMRRKEGLAGARLYLLAALLMLASLPVMYFSWQSSRYCAGLDPTETVQLLTDLQARCTSGCCSQKASSIHKELRDSTGNPGKARSIGIEDLKDDDGKCDGYRVHFNRTWPCHDDDWYWSSRQPRVFHVLRGAYSAAGYKQLEKQGYTFQFKR